MKQVRIPHGVPSPPLLARDDHGRAWREHCGRSERIAEWSTWRGRWWMQENAASFYDLGCYSAVEKSP